MYNHNLIILIPLSQYFIKNYIDITYSLLRFYFEQHFRNFLKYNIYYFLVVNILYVLVFLPEYTDSWSECCQSCTGGFLDKIKYKK
jgi:hypothetical protein